MRQRQEDLNFHDILATTNPNPFLRFNCELIDEMIRQGIEFRNDAPQAECERFGRANVKIHKEVTKVARVRDVEKVRS